ncbi:MAG: T9SS type A sorting domain-containing protein [Bacteroidota bacterium]
MDILLLISGPLNLIVKVILSQGDSIHGATQAHIPLAGAGMYQVSVSNDIGCSSWSDPLYANSEDTFVSDQVLSLDIYPNPANQILNIHWGGMEFDEFQLRVYSIDGRLVWANSHVSHSWWNGQQFSIMIDVDTWASGTYLILLYNNSHQILSYKRMIKMGQ